MIDTAAKRASIIGMDLPFVRVLPIPDGSIDVYDRKQFVFKYRFGEGGSGPVAKAGFAIYGEIGCFTIKDKK